MKCKYCLGEMEFELSEGISYSETRLYQCPMCYSEVTTHENGEEDDWTEG